MSTKWRYYVVYIAIFIAVIAFWITAFANDNPTLNLSWNPAIAIFWTLIGIFCMVNTRKNKTYPVIYLICAGCRFLTIYTTTGEWSYSMISLGMLALGFGTSQLLSENEPK